MAVTEDPVDETEADKGRNGLRWWQFLLVYPAIFVAFIEAGPDIVTKVLAWKNNETVREYLYFKQQHEWWQVNPACVSSDFDPKTSTDGLEVDAVLCPSSRDIFVILDSAESKRQYVGIPLKYLRDQVPFSERADLAPLVGAAFAATAPHRLHALASRPREVQSSVICTSFQSDGRTLLRHIRNGPACYDELVDTFTGQVRSVSEVPCRNTCQ